MTRNSKVLGVALVAILAMSAIAASSASATTKTDLRCTALVTANCWITSSGGEHGTGSNDNEFTVGTAAGAKTTVKCTGTATVDGAQVKATIPKTASEATVEATYEGCKAFGVKSTISMEGCDYLFKAVSPSSPATVTVDVKCPAGKAITIKPTGLACTVTVGAQTGLKHVLLENAGVEPTHIKATVTVEGITYTTTGAECPAGEAGTHNNGVYKGTITLTGFEDPGPTEPHPNKVGLHVITE